MMRTGCSRRWKALETGFLGVAILLSLVGCAGKKPVPPPQMTLNIQTDPATNKGQIFYMVLRSVTDRQFLSDSYQSVASLVFADPPDPTLLGAHAIVPGRKQVIRTVQPTQNALAFYFMFTEPADQWKKMVSQPLASAYNVGIDRDDAVVIEKRKGFFGRLRPF